MQLSRLRSLSLKSQISIAAVLVLVVLLSVTVSLTQQQQDTRSKASGADTILYSRASYSTTNNWAWTDGSSLGSIPTTYPTIYAQSDMSGLTDKDHVAGIRFKYTSGGSSVLVALSGTDWKIEPAGGTILGGTYSHSSSGTFRAEMTGNTVKIFWNGSLVTTQAFSTNATGTGIAPSIWQSTNGVTMSNIQAGIPGSAITPTTAPVAPTPTPTPVSGSTTPGTQKQVQKVFQVKQGTTSNALSLPGNVTAGNLLIVAVSHYQASLSSISDNRGDVLTPINSPKCAVSPTDCIELYYIKDAVGGQTTVTANFSGTTDNNLGVYEYSGYDTGAPLDKAVVATGTSSTPNGGSIATSVNNELIFALGVDNYGNQAAITAGSGYSIQNTQTDSASHERFYTEDKIAAIGTSSTNFTIAASSPWAVIGAAFKPAVAPTATPVPTSTPIPPTATRVPTATSVPTVAPTATRTPTPTGIALVTATPFPTSIPSATPTFAPTSVPLPTATSVPGSTVASVKLFLHGIGNGGDSVNPTSIGNTSPSHPQRTVIFEVYDVQNQLVVTKQGTLSYSAAAGDFIGNVDLGTDFNTGIYTVKMKTDKYLRGLVNGIQTITKGQINTLPALTLVAGDINNDNQINIVDYNILIGCYSDLLPAVNCTDSNHDLSDLTDDGGVNQFDYNLFVRELTNIGGQ